MEWTWQGQHFGFLLYWAKIWGESRADVVLVYMGNNQNLYQETGDLQRLWSSGKNHVPRWSDAQWPQHMPGSRGVDCRCRGCILSWHVRFPVAIVLSERVIFSSQISFLTLSIWSFNVAPKGLEKSIFHQWNGTFMVCEKLHLFC